MATAVAAYTYRDVYVAGFDFSTPVAQEGRAQWFPVRHFCVWLGIDSHSQLEWLKADSRFAQARRDIPYKTPYGWRSSLWIHRDKLALWLLHIEPSRCKLDSRDRLEQFQNDVVAAATALLFNAAPARPEAERAPASTSIRVETFVHCPDCGAPLHIIYEGDKTTVLRVRDH